MTTKTFLILWSILGFISSTLYLSSHINREERTGIKNNVMGSILILSVIGFGIWAGSSLVLYFIGK